MDVTIDDIFEAMPGRFRPEVAGEWRAAIQFRFEREGGEALRWLRVADGSCAVGEGEIEAPTCTVRTSADAWIGMVLGKLNPMQVFTSGQLRLEGNLADAMRLSDPRLFPRPEIVGPPPSEGDVALDFDLSPEHDAVRDTLRRCLAPFEPRRAELLDRILVRKEFPQDLWDAICSTGLMGCVVPEEYGGNAMGLVASAVGVEELASFGYGNVLLVLGTMDAACIARNGTEDMKRRYLPGIASGALKFCFAITEPNAGTNAFRIETIAKKDGDAYRITGSKTFITGADVADRMLLVCRTTSREDVVRMGLPKPFGMALFVVDPKSPGITLTPIPTRGIEGMRQFTVFFDDVVVPAEELVGQPDAGAFVMFNSLNPERILAAATACGMARYCLGKAVSYANERKVFGDRPIGAYQGISHPLARVKMELEAARLMTYRAAWAFDADKSPGEVGAAANAAKYLATEMAIAAVDRAIQTHGGYGFSEDYGIIWFWEAVRLLRTAPITAEMILNYVAEHELGLPRGVLSVPTMRERVEALQRERAKVREMGGADKIARQHERGKLTARERIDRLLDAGTFTELGILGSEYAERPAPADGVVTGLGEIDGRKVCVAAYDYTVLGGSIGLVGETKVTRLRKLAVTCGVPMVWLVDSAGARIDPRPENLEKIPLFADSGHLFHEQVLMSGVVPQVAAMMGPGYAGTAYVPGLADFVPMVKGSSAMALGGPALVRAAVGEEVDEEELGGSAVHNRESGCADQEAESDEECLQMVRTYLSFFPSSCRTPPPRKPSAPGRGLLPDEVLDLLPDDPRRTWDVKRLLPLLADDGFFFELKPYYARSMVTALARVAGYPVGVVANNPRHLAGAIDSAAASKAARFVDLCDAFGIPLVFLVDVPGFLVGTHAERSGIIDRGSRMLYAVSRATVPKITVVLRRAYGAGYYVMCGRAFEPDLIVAWPGAEICVMGPEGMVSIAAGKLLAHHPEPDALRRQITDMLAGHMDIANIARRGFVDDIIDPRETRDVLITALETTRDKRLERPWRRHGIAP